MTYQYSLSTFSMCSKRCAYWCRAGTTGTPASDRLSAAGCQNAPEIRQRRHRPSRPPSSSSRPLSPTHPAFLLLFLLLVLLLPLSPLPLASLSFSSLGNDPESNDATYRTYYRYTADCTTQTSTRYQYYVSICRLADVLFASV